MAGLRNKKGFTRKRDWVQIDDYLPWSEEWKTYESSIKEKENILTSIALNF